jgi:hypothetical protein
LFCDGECFAPDVTQWGSEKSLPGDGNAFGGYAVVVVVVDDDADWEGLGSYGDCRTAESDNNNIAAECRRQPEEPSRPSKLVDSHVIA